MPNLKRKPTAEPMAANENDLRLIDSPSYRKRRYLAADAAGRAFVRAQTQLTELEILDWL